MIGFITITAGISGIICLIAGIVFLILDYAAKASTLSAAKSAAAKLDEKVGEGDLTEQGAVGDVLDSVANLAKALKDLDTGTRVLVLSVAFLAVAAVAAGVGSVASAVSG
ncbi:MAG: hypothetical protein AUI14_13985 [Actinobacteria bacterium 13_2_20CM_2_71_6]|nr:MAG: hypothetical protein AUI14_13985 [Actinobacteria bacterium 13_2_20CM_2_71_6]